MHPPHPPLCIRPWTFGMGFSGTHGRTPFPVVLTSGFPRIPSTSVSVGRPQKQLTVRLLNFANGKSYAIFCGYRFILSSNRNNCRLLYFNANNMCSFTKKLQLLGGGDFVPQVPYRGSAAGHRWGTSVPRPPVFFYVLPIIL